MLDHALHASTSCFRESKNSLKGLGRPTWYKSIYLSPVTAAYHFVVDSLVNSEASHFNFQGYNTLKCLSNIITEVILYILLLETN